MMSACQRDDRNANSFESTLGQEGDVVRILPARVAAKLVIGFPNNSLDPFPVLGATGLAF